MLQILSVQLDKEKLKLLIRKCLDITEDWHSDVNLKDFERTKKTLFNRQQPQRQEMVDVQASPRKAPPALESKFSYSVDEGNFQIPQFMKNDLDQIKKHLPEVPNEDYQFEDQFIVTRMGKIRKSTYYIIARSIKFGLDTSYLINQCHLTQKIIKDLSLQHDNSFIFQNLLEVVSNLKLEKAAIVDLIGNNYESIIEQIFITQDRDRRISLLKVLINLILEASEDLSTNPMLFQKVFEICKDQRSDENMIEKVLWLATQLCEQSNFNTNFNLVIQQMIENQVLLIIWKCLSSKQERIILQALKLLSKISDYEDFKERIFAQKELFQQLKEISINTDSLVSYKVEIQTMLCNCLEKITQAALPESPLSLSQIDQIKIFNKYLINLALQKDYIVKRKDVQGHQPKLDEAEVPEESFERSLGKDSKELLAGADYILDQAQIEYFKRVGSLEDVERLQDSNLLVENILHSLSNISKDETLHQELVANGLLEVYRKFVNLLLSSAMNPNPKGVNEEQEGIDLLAVVPSGTLSMMKSIMNSLVNLSTNPAIQGQCLDEGIIDLLLDSQKLNDYEMITNIYKTIGNMLTSPEDETRKKMVHQGFLQEMLHSHEYSPLFKIRRICSEYLNQILTMDPSLFELNDFLNQRIVS